MPSFPPPKAMTSIIDRMDHVTSSSQWDVPLATKLPTALINPGLKKEKEKIPAD